MSLYLDLSPSPLGRGREELTLAMIHQQFRLGSQEGADLATETRNALVATLFGSPASLAIGAVAGAAVALTIALRTADAWLGTLALAITIVGCLRVAHLSFANRRVEAQTEDPRDERLYEIGAWIYSALLGLLTLSVLTRTSAGDLHLLTTCLTIGYAAGIAARNAGRPLIAAGQMFLAAAPLTVAGILVGGATYWLLAGINILFMAALADITRKTYTAVLTALERARGRENQWKETLDSLPQMVWSTDGEGKPDYQNRQWLEFTGLEFKQREERRIDAVHPDDAPRILEEWRRCILAGSPYEAQYRVQHREGGYRWVLSRGLPHRGVDGRVLRWYGTCTDIHDHMLAQESLAESEHLSRSILEASPDCISLLDAAGNVVFANRAALRAYGLEEEKQLLGLPWGHRLSGDTQTARAAAFDAARAGGLGRVTLSMAHPNGEVRWYEALVAPLAMSSSTAPRFMVLSRDITDQKSIEHQVRWAAGHDMLTKLPNRSLFQQGLERAICENGKGGFTLLLLDIDNFKQVNDTLGHDAGDSLLCAAADRLKAAIREGDLVARLGGDEFAVLLPNVGTEASAKAVAGKILDRLRDPWVFNGRVGDCRASIGASIFSKHGTEASSLLKNADMALYTAKLNGRGQVAVFRPGMRAEMRKRSAMLDVARSAIKNDWIRPYYQPKVDLRSEEVVGFEALLRWKHPTRGAQAPSTIAAAFDDYELASQLTEQMLARAIADMRSWLDRGVPFGHVAFNASAADFKQIRFAENFIQRLEEARIPTECVQVEVTETVFLGRGADYVERALKMLSAHGIRIALDDFGTGYASLSHLKQFPVDIVKIDRSFVRDIQAGEGNAAIIKAVLNLGRSLDLDVVAEGIETAAQLAYLMTHGCRTGQGYYFGKAVPAARVPLLLGSARQSKAA